MERTVTKQHLSDSLEAMGLYKGLYASIRRDLLEYSWNIIRDLNSEEGFLQTPLGAQLAARAIVVLRYGIVLNTYNIGVVDATIDNMKDANIWHGEFVEQMRNITIICKHFTKHTKINNDGSAKAFRLVYKSEELARMLFGCKMADHAVAESNDFITNNKLLEKLEKVQLTPVTRISMLSAYSGPAIARIGKLDWVIKD